MRFSEIPERARRNPVRTVQLPGGRCDLSRPQSGPAGAAFLETCAGCSKFKVQELGSAAAQEINYWTAPVAPGEFSQWGTRGPFHVARAVGP